MGKGNTHLSFSTVYLDVVYKNGWKFRYLNSSNGRDYCTNQLIYINNGWVVKGIRINPEKFYGGLYRGDGISMIYGKIYAVDEDYNFNV